MKPFYVCEICTSSYQEDLRNNKDGHYVALSNEHPQPRKCKGTLQPAFLARDIEKLIKGRIEEYSKEVNTRTSIYDGKRMNSKKIEELQSLLSALEGNE